MKILALTSIRSDYDLLSPLYFLLERDSDIELKLLVSGAHLSKEFGYTKKYIENDGFEILLEIETLINSDSKKSRIKTASIFLQNSIDIIEQFNPDIILYAGDREDVIMGGILGLYLNIPTIHFYGGDHEEDGHQDTYIRHATSKLSTFHFVASMEHKERLLSLGEPHYRIFNIGAISLDRLHKVNEENLSKYFNMEIPNEFVLLIYHPIVNEDAKTVFENMIIELKNRGIFAFISYPNSDPEYNQIIEVIDRYKSDNNFIFYKNLPRKVFLTIFKKSRFIIGNSSAGISEAATFKKMAINVGIRQKNRLKSKNILYIDTNREDISKYINLVLSNKFEDITKKIENIYGDGKSANRAYNLIKTLDLKKYQLKIEDPLLENKDYSYGK